MKATSEECKQFEIDLQNLVSETNPRLFPFMFLDMMTNFDNIENPKEFINVIKEKYCYKDLKELVDKTENKDSFDFYKEIYDLGFINACRNIQPHITSMAEGSKSMLDKLEKYVDKACTQFCKSCKNNMKQDFFICDAGHKDKCAMLNNFKQAIEE